MNSIFIFKFKFKKHLIFLHEKLKINWIELKSKSFWRKKNKTIRLFEICLYATFRKNLRKWKTKYLYTTLTKKSDIKLLSSKDFFFELMLITNHYQRELTKSNKSQNKHEDSKLSRGFDDIDIAQFDVISIESCHLKCTISSSSSTSRFFP